MRRTGPLAIAFLSTSAARSTVIGDFVSDENATTRISAPSSSRMFDGMTFAMNESTSSGTGIFSDSAFLRRIASRVSRSGCWMSVSSPHSNRERSRDSSVWISLGGRSLEMTSCRCASWRLLKVWKNSS